MLTFTFQDDRVAGTFNGRFAFRAPMQVDPLSLAALEAIANGQDSALETDVLRHEYLHWAAFRASTFGIETIGRRFRSRAAFLRGRHEEVVSYYRQRTAYFCCSYREHEAIVDENFEICKGMNLDALRRSALSKEHVARIRSADLNARQATIALSSLADPITRSLDFAKGYMATREYGLQNYIPDRASGKRIREVSLASGSGGVLNAAFETEIGRQGTIVSFIKKMRRKLNTEGRLGGLNNEKMGAWAAIKFATESQTLAQLRRLKFPSSVESFEDYARKTADFAFRYILAREDRLLKMNLISLLLDCQSEAKTTSETEVLGQRFAEFDEGILYYFYIHGN